MNSMNQLIQLTIGAVVGFGLSIGMEKRGISLFSSETRVKAVSYLFIFCCAWITGMTLITHFFGK